MAALIAAVAVQQLVHARDTTLRDTTSSAPEFSLRCPKLLCACGRCWIRRIAGNEGWRRRFFHLRVCFRVTGHQIAGVIVIWSMRTEAGVLAT